MAYQKLILMGMVIVGFVCLSNGADYYTPRPTPGPCSHVKCGYGAVCIVKDYKPVCVCNTACILIYKPVCGSDGKTYGNECMLRVASCKQQKHIKIAHQGKCAEVCHYNYRTYKVGESFTKNCNARCTCQADGNVACVPLCPLVLIKCPAGSVVKYRQVPVGNGCFCRRPYCVPPVCRDNNRTYKVGESFIKSDCSARCTCQAGGNIACVSLCPPVLIRCLPGHVVKYRKVPQGNGCFCKRPYCVPAPKPTTPRPKVCRYDDRTYKVGESFITKDCKGKCTCQAGGNVACVSLCPPVRIICPAGQVIRYRQVPVGNGCSCRRPYCAKRDIYTPY